MIKLFYFAQNKKIGQSSSSHLTKGCAFSMYNISQFVFGILPSGFTMSPLC